MDTPIRLEPEARRPSRFERGQRVRQRRSGETGEVAGTRPQTSGVHYLVDFPSGRQSLPANALAPLYPDPWSCLRAGHLVVDPYDGWLRSEALRLDHAYRNDPVTVLSNSRVEPQPHQVEVLSRTIEKSQPRMILADEVGLGKTIEAGLILKELRARGVLERVLIMTPASLVTQWQFELESKFNECFVLCDGEKIRKLQRDRPDNNPWAQLPNVLCTIPLARAEPHATHIAEAPWDLVIVDEAHHARRSLSDGDIRANLAYQLLWQLRDRVPGMLLLTATPMQLDAYELYSTLDLVEPGLFTDYDEFIAARDAIAESNRAIAWLRSGDRSLVRKRDVQALLHRLWAPGDVLKFDDTVEVRERVADWLAGRHQLSSALIRHRKREIGGFKSRLARRIHVEPTAREVELERDVLAYIRRQHEASEGSNAGSIGLVLTTFRKLLASSPLALASALQNRAQTIEGSAELDISTDDPDERELLERANRATTVQREAEAAELRGLAARARDTPDSKLVELERAISSMLAKDPNQKVLIFTQYLATLETIRARLSKLCPVEVFHGGLSRDEKDAAHRAFKGPVNILVSSEAGGEGRNFQFCHVLVNYDLPWNPMRIEQRIGRLDRVGQRHDVLVYNFAVQGTLDERILDLLEHRIRIFTESVGELEPILGKVEDSLCRAFLRDRRAAERSVVELGIDLEREIRRARQREDQLSSMLLDQRRLRRDRAATLLGESPLATSEDLERFIRRALDRYPNATVRTAADGRIALEPPRTLTGMGHDGRRVHDRYVGTFRVDDALEDERLEFFAFGAPVVDSVMREVTDPGFTPPVGLLTSTEVTGPGLLVDYEIHTEGVRNRTIRRTYFVDATGVHDTPAVELPDAPRRFVSIEADASWTEILEQVSLKAARVDLLREKEAFEEENVRALDEERNRIDRLYDSQVRAMEHRVAQAERTAAQMRRGTASQQRAAGTQEGRARSARREIARLERVREQALVSLEAAAVAQVSLEVTMISIVVPISEVPKGGAE